MLSLFGRNWKYVKIAAPKIALAFGKRAAATKAAAAAGAGAGAVIGGVGGAGVGAVPGAAVGGGTAGTVAGVVNTVWFAYDVYDIYNIVMEEKTLSALDSQLDSLPEEIQNLENGINSKEEEVKKEIILPDLKVLIEEYQKLPEFTENPEIIDLKKIYETQICSAFKKVFPELKDTKIEELVTSPISSKNNFLFKEGELSMLLGNPRGTRELELIEIWKKIINFIKYSFDNLPLTINISVSKTIKKIKLKIDKVTARFPKVENWLIENMKFIHKDKGFISLYALGGYGETSSYLKFYKVGDKEILKGERNSELIYSIGETSSLLPENINKRIEIKERENKAQSIKTNILNSIKTIILASN